MEVKYDAFEAKSIFRYRRGKTHAAAAKDNKREVVRYGQRENENTKRRKMSNEARVKTRLQQEEELKVIRNYKPRTVPP